MPVPAAEELRCGILSQPCSAYIVGCMQRYSFLYAWKRISVLDDKSNPQPVMASPGIYCQQSQTPRDCLRSAPAGRYSSSSTCRAAQRRFRERQKNLIQELKDRETALAKQCDEQKRLIEQLQKENQVLKEIMHAKDSK